MSRYSEISQFRKSFDIITNWVHYPIATYFCALISFTKITPNQITLLAIISELSAVYFIFTNYESNLLLIVGLLQIGYILDLSDGMLARYKKVGYYHPTNPSIKGYYLDSISDHVLRFILMGSLVFIYSVQVSNGWKLGLFFIIIHGILQTEHTLRSLITSSRVKDTLNGRSTVFSQMALLHNNIYIFYLIFISINRLDLFFIIYSIGSIVLFCKRVAQFWLKAE